MPVQEGSRRAAESRKRTYMSDLNSVIPSNRDNERENMMWSEGYSISTVMQLQMCGNSAHATDGLRSARRPYGV